MANDVGKMQNLTMSQHSGGMSVGYWLYDLFPPPACPYPATDLAELGEIISTTSKPKRQGAASYDDCSLDENECEPRSCARLSSNTGTRETW